MKDIERKVSGVCTALQLKQDISAVAFGLTIDNMSKEDAARKLLSIILNDIPEEGLEN